MECIHLCILYGVSEEARFRGWGALHILERGWLVHLYIPKQQNRVWPQKYLIYNSTAIIVSFNTSPGRDGLESLVCPTCECVLQKVVDMVWVT